MITIPPAVGAFILFFAIVGAWSIGAFIGDRY
jgi:hypothetical protein